MNFKLDVFFSDLIFLLHYYTASLPTCKILLLL